MPSCNVRPATDLCAPHGEQACLGTTLKIQTNSPSINVWTLKLDQSRDSISSSIRNYSFSLVYFFFFGLFPPQSKKLQFWRWIFGMFVQRLTPAAGSRRWRCGCVDCRCWCTPGLRSRSTVGRGRGETSVSGGFSLFKKHPGQSGWAFLLSKSKNVVPSRLLSNFAQ